MRDIAKWIVSNIGGCVELHPRVLFPSRIRTPDYIWNGEKWDLKTINSHSKNTLTTAVKNIKKQANNVILDIRSDSYTNDVLNAELDRIYNNKRYDYLEKTMIIRCFKLIGIFKRKNNRSGLLKLLRLLIIAFGGKRYSYSYLYYTQFYV